ncbi:MAG: hypothetical protein K8J09_06765 [Planctomycetes bacterium]|nr:hypothetical protein [Planctomycetota bacterium]MCC7396002.1 hypothetical protein [Planctomycetota bacterium]
MSKGKPKAARGSGREVGSGGDLGARWLLVGFVLFLVSWFVPVVRGQDLFGALPAWGEKLGVAPEAGLQAVSGPDWLPGWGACRFAWQLLVSEDQGNEWFDRSKLLTLGATCLTNLVMVLAMLLAVARRCRLGCGLALLGCAALDASWIYYNDQNPFDLFRVGYFLWLGSFVVAGVGALLSTRRG